MRVARSEIGPMRSGEEKLVCAEMYGPERWIQGVELSRSTRWVLNRILLVLFRDDRREGGGNRWGR